MKIILFITIIFSNGTMVEDKIPFKSYDECYVNAMMLIQKIESQKIVDRCMFHVLRWNEYVI